MKKHHHLPRAMELLGEIVSQDFVTDALWDYKELRRWRKKTINLLRECGYVEAGECPATPADGEALGTQPTDEEYEGSGKTSKPRK